MGQTERCWVRDKGILSDGQKQTGEERANGDVVVSDRPRVKEMSVIRGT